ncbi:MAG: DUF1800 domain-containing protein [Proteobacteria bacterium]|nr:DUF1800 domain-containing protein [Pseudomonadota bacterium]HQR03400.1 DUF1800 domain-containing protein [Rhodocyclaceae bacterium]
MRFHLRLLSVCAGLLLSAGWAIAAPATPIGVEGAKHLLNRTAFGATPAEIHQYAKLDRTEAVDHLLQEADAAPPPSVPEGLADYLPPSRLRAAEGDDKKQLIRQIISQGLDLKSWWLNQMLIADTPGAQFRERMTLFWHNHFTSSLEKVKEPALLLRQNQLLRQEALGNFGRLLHAVGKDPAMVVYLDSATNRRGQPNENFAREVMELFTLGEGNYTEADIHEAARAYTGWSIDPETGDYKWRPFAHDGGSKTVLGQTGNFNGDDILDILLSRPETARFVMTKLWRSFVSPEPDAKQIEKLARTFRDSRYDIRAAMRALLLSPAFWAPENHAVLIKSPVDLVVGSLRTLSFHVPDPYPFIFSLRQQGEDIFSPPNVKGWPGGDAWINTNSLLARKQFLDRLLRDDGGGGGNRQMMGQMMAGGKKLGMEGRTRLASAMSSIRFDASAWNDALSQSGLTAEQALLALPPADTVSPEMADRAVLRALVLDPAYQVK